MLRCMRQRGIGRRSGCGVWAAGVAVAVGFVAAAPVRADLRNFVVMPATSPKTTGAYQQPAIPLAEITNAYFAENPNDGFVSFREYWKEISYGNAQVTGQRLEWVFLPWPLEAPDAVQNGQLPEFANNAVMYFDLDASRQFSYGLGEVFDEFEQMFEFDWDGNFEPDPEAMDPGAPPREDPDDGEAIDVVFNGVDVTLLDFFLRAPLVDGVWTPGERWWDEDGDGRWDVLEVCLVPDTGGGCFTDFLETGNSYVDVANSDVADPIGVLDPGTFADFDGDGIWDVGELWEDFMVRYDPTRPPGARWVRVTNDYIRKNYPGDAELLISGIGDGWYEGPDSWVEYIPPQNLSETTKLIENGLPPLERTPRPGWLDKFWEDRYGGDPPPWNDRIPGLQPFDPAVPDPLASPGDPRTGEALQRGFRPLFRYDWTMEGFNSWYPDPAGPYMSADIQPDATGVYDGPPEFDDLASSRYHNTPVANFEPRYTNGDMRMGEVTSPFPTVNNAADSNFGEDRYSNPPENDTVSEGGGDNQIPAAGPLAYRVHGNNLRDPGNVLNLEYLTWRTDGTYPTLPRREQVGSFMLGLYDFAVVLGLVGPGEPFSDFGIDGIDGTLDFGEGDGVWNGPAEERCEDALCTEFDDFGYDGIPGTGDEGEGNTIRDVWPGEPFQDFGRDGLPATFDVGEGDGEFTYGGGYRDFNLDGLIDQGETVVPGAMNYFNDPIPTTPDNLADTLYPFNRDRITEDVIEVNDDGFNYETFAVGGSLPGVVYSGILLDGLPELRERSPRLLSIPTRDGADGGQPVIVNNLVGRIGTTPTYNNTTIAHEYGHFWEGWPDLYDIVSAALGLGRPGPVAGWDLMASGPLSHITPMLKQGMGGATTHAPWVTPVRLEAVLSPGIASWVNFSRYELNPNNSAFTFTNPDDPAEQYYLWRVTRTAQIPILGNQVTTNFLLPASGLIVMYQNAGVCGPPLTLCQQQPPPYIYRIVQADGLFELEDSINTGDAGDPFGSASGVREWLEDRSDNKWKNGGTTGLEILDVQEPGEGGQQNFRVRFLWTPQDTPWLVINRPPGGESSGGVYNLNFDANDRFGGTRIEFYREGPFPNDFDGPPTGFAGTPLCATLNPEQEPVAPTNCTGIPPIPTQIRKNVGRTNANFPISVSTLPNGNYFFYARLVPGIGDMGRSEQWCSIARPAVGNGGNGVLRQPSNLAILPVSDGTTCPLPPEPCNKPPIVDPTKVLIETWTVTCTDDCFDDVTGQLIPGCFPTDEEWRVEGSRSEVQTTKAFTNTDYVSDDGLIAFQIINGTTRFRTGDRFFFTTTGKTEYSGRLRVNNGLVTSTPVAAFTASPLSGGSPVVVNFDASDSFNPDTGDGSGLDYLWDFGDNTTGTGMFTSHTFTNAGPNPADFLVVLTVINQETGEPNANDASQVIRVTVNRPPNGCISHVNAGVPAFTGDTGPSNNPASGYELQVQAVPCPGEQRIDPDGDTVIVDWDFGDSRDGTCDPNGCIGRPLSEIVSHTYKVAGTYTLKMTVRESSGSGQSMKTQQVTITGNQAPNAVITPPVPIGGPLTQVYNLSASQSTDDFLPGLTYDWDFGDGTNGAGINVQKQYASAGAKLVTLTVTDTLGVQDTDTVTIFAGNQNPVASFTTVPNPPVIGQNESVAFNATASTDPDGDPLTYAWDFNNDGTTDASGVTTQFQFTAEGTFTVRLTVADGKGGTGTTTRDVIVTRNDAPVIQLTASPTSGPPPLQVNFTAAGTTDRETAANQLRYTWNFGDGTAVAQGFGLISVNHTYNVEGQFVATLSVTDGVNTSVKQIGIGVAVPPPSPPAAALTSNPSSGPAPLTVLLDASLTTDPDNDLASFLWDFGDGSLSVKSIADVKTVSHTFANGGTFIVRLTATDKKGLTSSATLAVNVTGGGGGTGQPQPGPCGFNFNLMEVMSLSLLGLVGMKRRFHARRAAVRR